MIKQKLTKDEIRKQADKQRHEDKKLDEFFKNYNEINKYNLENFKELFAHEFFVERLLYINNKVFKYKEKISFEQIVALGGVIIPYKQGVVNVTLNQRVNLLEGDVKELKFQMTDVQTILAQHSIQIGALQSDVTELKTQMTDMKTQMTDMSNNLSYKIDKLTDLLTEHIKTHK